MVNNNVKYAHPSYSYTVEVCFKQKLVYNVVL